MVTERVADGKAFGVPVSLGGREIDDPNACRLALHSRTPPALMIDHFFGRRVMAVAIRLAAP